MKELNKITAGLDDRTKELLLNYLKQQAENGHMSDYELRVYCGAEMKLMKGMLRPRCVWHSREDSGMYKELKQLIK